MEAISGTSSSPVPKLLYGVRPRVLPGELTTDNDFVTTREQLRAAVLDTMDLA